MAFLFPVGLSALAMVVLGAGLPFSGKFRRRRRYIGGLISIAAGLISLWLLQIIVSVMDVQWETRWVLQIGAFILSFFLLASGVGAVC